MNREFRTIESQCAERQRNLDTTHDVDARTTLAKEIVLWCQQHMHELELAYHGALDEYWRHYRLWFGQAPPNAPEREIDDQIREARFYYFGRIAFLAVESIAAAILAVMFFNAPALVAAVLGIALALFLGAAANSGVARWVRHDAAMQPSKQLARVSRGLFWCFVPWLISVVVALAILRNEPSGFGAALFLAMTTVVTLLSPLCSALCAYSADLLFWSRRLCADLRRLRALARNIQHLDSIATQCLPVKTPKKEVKYDDTKIRLIRSAAPIAFLAVFLGAPGAVGAYAADIPVHIYPDVSPSVRSADVSHVLKEFSARLEAYNGANTLVVSIVPFYEDAFSAPAIARIRIAPVTDPPCDIVVSSGGEVAKLSRAYAERAMQEAKAKCEASRRFARSEAQKQRTAEIVKLNAAISQVTGMKLTGHCTAVNAMLRRAVTEMPRGISILISDLENDCPPHSLPTVAGNRLFIIPVGSRSRPVEDWFDSTQARFARQMPGTRFVESFSIDVIIDAIRGVDLQASMR